MKATVEITQTIEINKAIEADLHVACMGPFGLLMRLSYMNKTLMVYRLINGFVSSHDGTDLYVTWLSVTKPELERLLGAEGFSINDFDFIN